MKITLDQDQSNLLYFCKGHYGDKSNKSLGEIYKELYCMDEVDVEGVYHMMRDLWIKIIQNVDDWRRDKMLLDYDNDSLPTNNWKVGGRYKPFEAEEQCIFDAKELLWARIRVMRSQIALSNISLFEFLPPEKKFAGLKLIKKQ